MNKHDDLRDKHDDPRKEISHDALREEISKEMNGRYATQICKKCKNFLSSPSGHTSTAKIINGCNNCMPEDRSRNILDFLEYLEHQGIYLHFFDPNEKQWMPIHYNLDEVIDEYINKIRNQ